MEANSNGVNFLTKHIFELTQFIELEANIAKDHPNKDNRVTSLSFYFPMHFDPKNDLLAKFYSTFQSFPFLEKIHAHISTSLYEKLPNYLSEFYETFFRTLAQLSSLKELSIFLSDKLDGTAYLSEIYRGMRSLSSLKKLILYYYKCEVDGKEVGQIFTNLLQLENLHIRLFSSSVKTTNQAELFRNLMGLKKTRELVFDMEGMKITKYEELKGLITTLGQMDELEVLRLTFGIDLKNLVFDTENMVRAIANITRLKHLGLNLEIMDLKEIDIGLRKCYYDWLQSMLYRLDSIKGLSVKLYLVGNSFNLGLKSLLQALSTRKNIEYVDFQLVGESNTLQPADSDPSDICEIISPCTSSLFKEVLIRLNRCSLLFKLCSNHEALKIFRKSFEELPQKHLSLLIDYEQIDAEAQNSAWLNADMDWIISSLGRTLYFGLYFLHCKLDEEVASRILQKIADFRGMRTIGLSLYQEEKKVTLNDKVVAKMIDMVNNNPEVMSIDINLSNITLSRDNLSALQEFYASVALLKNLLYFNFDFEGSGTSENGVSIKEPKIIKTSVRIRRQVAIHALHLTSCLSKFKVRSEIKREIFTYYIYAFL